MAGPVSDVQAATDFLAPFADMPQLPATAPHTLAAPLAAPSAIIASKTPLYILAGIAGLGLILLLTGSEHR